MSTNLYVGNLSYDIDSAKLEEIFSKVGKVTSAEVISDRYSGRSRGFGFVQMSSEEEAKKAIDKLNGKEIDGKALVVNEAKPREERKPRRFSR